MTRTAAREIAVRLCYAVTATGAEPESVLSGFFEGEHYASMVGEDKLFESAPSQRQMDYIRALVAGVTAHKAELDAYIEKYSKGWKLGRITRTAAACLRCALCEILYMSDFDVNTAVAINEAVELSKSYEEPDTVAFINGVLGAFVRGELGESMEEAPEASEEA